MKYRSLVALVFHLAPGEEASPDIRAAQVSFWKDGIALAGPDSAALKRDLRENGGKGVHFSGPRLGEDAARKRKKSHALGQASHAPYSLPDLAEGSHPQTLSQWLRWVPPLQTPAREPEARTARCFGSTFSSGVE